MVDFNKVLVLSPHADDGQLGCGGTIARWIGEGKEIYYVMFSSAKKSIPSNLPHDILIKECLASNETLGISHDKTIVLDYEVRTFPTYRQEILEDMIELKNKIKPNLVLTPSSSDTHQDHNTIYWETLRAFKKEASIWGYEHPWNNLNFTTDIFVRLDEKHLKKKIVALKCYKSQVYLHRMYFEERYIRSQSCARGTQVDYRNVEVFELIRMLL